MNTIKKMLMLFVLMVGLAACSNTFHGAGEDIESAGQSIQDATR